MADLDYDGRIYIRPIGRGVVLEELASKDLAEAIEEAAVGLPDATALDPAGAAVPGSRWR